MTDLAAFRAEFPVLERVAYLNAGTDGPVPSRGAEAAAARVRLELEEGRLGESHFEGLERMRVGLRSELAARLGCEAGEVALTHSTTDGINTVLSGLDLSGGGEVLTSDEEHPGLLAPLAAAARRHRFAVREVPFDRVADEVRPSTRLVAVSHVSWVSGRIANAAGLAAASAPLLLDGAQGLGAVEIDVRALGCDFYAASGQKWLCGPDGSGCLYVRAGGDALSAPWPSYIALAEPGRASELMLHADARRYDLGVAPGALLAWSLASLELLADAGWGWVLERGPALARELADALAERGLEVTPRDGSTLVSWRSDDPESTARRLADEHISVRHLPGRGLVRASVGAWTTEAELERLLELVA